MNITIKSSRSRTFYLAILVFFCALASALLFILGRSDIHRQGSLAHLPSTVDAGAPGPAVPVVSSTDESASQRGALSEVADAAPASNDSLAQEVELRKAKEALADQATAGLDGVLYVNEVLDNVLTFANLEVDDHPDYDYEDNDALAYKLKSGTDGTEARVLVGLQPYEENGRSFRYLQLQIDIGSGESKYLRDSMREGPSIGLSISYDETDGNTPTRFALILQRRVDLTASKKQGIDAYHGKYTSGASYWVDLQDTPPRLLTGTIGIVDGNPVDARSFNDLSPLVGDIELDKNRLTALLKQLQQHQSTIKRK